MEDVGFDAETAGCVGAVFTDVSVAEVPALSVPFAATSCSILLLDGATGVVFAALSSVFFVAFALDFMLVFAPFFPTSSSAFAAFAAFVDAFLVPVFFTSSPTSSTTFFGRPRFLTGSPVAVTVAVVVDIIWVSIERI